MGREGKRALAMGRGIECKTQCTLEGASNIEVNFLGTYRPGVILHGGNTPTH